MKIFIKKWPFSSKHMNKTKIKELIDKKHIKWIQVHFTDLIGGLRVLHIPANQFLSDDVISKGINFDGSSVGFRRVEKSDMIALPDIETFNPIAYEKDEAIIRANLYDTEYNPYRAGPRNILKKAIETAKKNGFDKVMISPEMEFCCFKKTKDENNEFKGDASYFSPPPLDDLKEYRKRLSDVLMESGYQVKYHHHEKGKFQHEIEVKSLEALDAADFCSYFKFVAREIASLFDIDITFMPKPLSEEAGSGMHAHIALYNKGKNMFIDEKNKYRLSETALYFIGGILEHSRGTAAFANPTLNSYKRLIPNFEAPIYIAWDQYNRSSLVRIPAKKNVDIEVRNADPAANPYFLFAALIYSGLDGIKNKTKYNPVSKNIYKMTYEEIKKYNIKQLPTNLMEALEELQKDKVLIENIGRDATDLFIGKKVNEWNKYTGEITDLDYRFYFNC
jgi:glutamine synthetase